MQLFYSGNSPYARRPRIAIREAGLRDCIEEVLSAGDEREAMLFKYGPGAKVPGLLTDSGAYICETLLINMYLNELSGGKLYPKEKTARDLAFQIDGIASLLMESLFYRSHEIRREDGKNSQGFIDKELARANRTYDALENLVVKFSDDLHLGLISTVASLGYADWRLPGDEWRSGRSKLTVWYEEIMKRPAMDETKPIF